MFAAVTAVIAATLTGAVSVVLDRDLVTVLNTALNFASWWLLIRAQRNLRKEVTPKLEHIEEVATTALESRKEGGRRRHDPSGEGEY